MTELEGWVTSDIAAMLTGYNVGHIRRLAREGRIGTRRVGRDWLVNRQDLLAYKSRMDALGTDKHNPWREDLDNGRGRKSNDESGQVVGT